MICTFCGEFSFSKKLSFVKQSETTIFFENLLVSVQSGSLLQKLMLI